MVGYLLPTLTLVMLNSGRATEMDISYPKVAESVNYVPRHERIQRKLCSMLTQRMVCVHMTSHFKWSMECKPAGQQETGKQRPRDYCVRNQFRKLRRCGVCDTLQNLRFDLLKQPLLK
jgi:hypothetical protein